VSEELKKRIDGVMADSQKRTAAEMDLYILRFFGDKATFEEFAHLYILEVIHPSEFETMQSNDLFADNLEYKIRITTTYRLRRKTQAELAKEVVETSQELHAL